MDRLVLLYAIVLLGSDYSSDEDELNELDSMIEVEYNKEFYRKMLMKSQVN